MRISKNIIEQAKLASGHLSAAASSIRILRNLAWDDSLRTKFLIDKRPPNPEYLTADTSDCLYHIKEANRQIQGSHVVFAWLERISTSLEQTAHMLETRGSRDFHKFSCELYGAPTKHLIDRKTRVIDMARHMDKTLAELDIDKLVIDGYETFMDSETFAEKLRPHLTEHFDQKAPSVEIHDNLSAKASAGSRRIRIRSGEKFTQRDVYQLIQHEALIHASTALNGRAQPFFPIIGRALARTTEIQEGLAVFAEMISGAMDPRRFRRLADRVLAIQMSIDGANFNEVFDFYVERTDNQETAYENTRRVFRGGLISGGAPFTKDLVYLNGLLRVHNFMRSVVKMGRADLIRLLFVGKLDIEDVPALALLAREGWVEKAEFMPPWSKDLRFLVSYLGYSSFLNKVKLPGFQAYYSDLLADVPEIWDEVS